MEEKKKSKSLYAKFWSLLKAESTRWISLTVMFILAGAFMLLMDDHNAIRSRNLGFLEDNFIIKFFEMFGLKSFNVNKASWLYFILFFSVVTLFLLGVVFQPLFLRRMMKGKKKKSDAEKKKFKTILLVAYYGVIALVAAAGVALIVLIAKAAMPSIFRVPVNGQMFLNLFLVLLLLLVAFWFVPFLLITALYILKFVFWLIGLAIFYVVKFYHDITKQFESTNTVNISGVTVPAATDEGVPAAAAKEKTAEEKDMFFALARLDTESTAFDTTPTKTGVNLEEFILQFQSFAINKHQIYYGLSVLRSFVAGLAASRLIILEGLSGTGKSMLPRMFSEFTGCHSFFAPVQATWRDKSDMLGYYSEFTKAFKVTDFLKKLYSASYYDDVNIMVLDEMNLSRIEYYFADFLSVMEYPKEDWKIKLVEPEIGQKLPAKLDGGYVRIPANTWFVGTANTDDSTFTITDKVYDRAFVIDFKERFSPITSDYNSDPLHMDANELEALFEAAKADESNRLTAAEEDQFLKLCSHVRDHFDIRFGNRIMVQINSFIPVYVAMGGKKEEALDIMFARKILRKLDGMYDDYLKDSLIELKKLITTLYGKGVFKETERFIDKIIRRLV